MVSSKKSTMDNLSKENPENKNFINIQDENTNQKAKKNKKNKSNKGCIKQFLSSLSIFLKSEKILIIRIINIILILIFFSLFFNSSLFGWDESCYISNALRIQGKTTILENIRPMFISIIGLVFKDNILLYKLFSFSLIPALYLLISIILQTSLKEKYKKHAYLFEAFLLFSFISFHPLYDLVGLFMVEIFSVFISFLAIIFLSKIELKSPLIKNYILSFLSGILFSLLGFSRYPFLIFFPIVIGYFLIFAKKNKLKLSLYFSLGFIITSILFVMFLKYFLGIGLLNSLIEAFFAVENEYAYLYQESIFYYAKSLFLISPIFFVFLVFALLDFLYTLLSKFLKGKTLDNTSQRTRFIISFFFLFNLALYTLFTHKEIRFLMYMFFYLVAHYAILIGNLKLPLFTKIHFIKDNFIKKVASVFLIAMLLIAIISSVGTIIISSSFISNLSNNIKSKEDISHFMIDEEEGDIVFFVPDPRYSLLNPDKKINAIYASAYFLNNQLNAFLYNPTKLIEKDYFDAPCAIFIINKNTYPISENDSQTLKILNESITLLNEKSETIYIKNDYITFYKICR